MAEKDPTPDGVDVAPRGRTKRPAATEPQVVAEAGTDAVEAPAGVPAGVTLTRGEDTVTAYKPGTVTTLKSQGWTVTE